MYKNSLLKAIDKWQLVWYNKYNERGKKSPKEKGDSKMKNTYQIEIATVEAYNKAMRGEPAYGVEKVEIEAETKEQAIEIATNKYPKMVVNKNYVFDVKELERQAAEHAERVAKAEAREAAKKARAIEREKEKAAELGLTVEQYKAKKNHERRIREVKNKIAQLEAELAEAKKYLEKLEG